ncbi:hypothetical protein A3H03_02955 [Candidatus Kuenenbacteria bacterium RIFCSPLOWO2_12_FULL_42_13]|uniref:Histidine kinase n=4 Tax=Candidatus Kueneniibacteriota TaxID=1752740 RepID=A0A0G0YSR7_9BACT|nr:MAG: hypothetical protein UV02_C0059G0006 [Candidatus Kuenenbacteria bacterium GW2011_GWA2_42_15]OGG89472.1 MAG: hypothetical protein A3C68_01900 [Candidatus Kuenenbacteria bacterium RIFCSPHIGHO2_02_FULL_42_29]OGG91127.1 MAG: hypothetical protein A3H55_02205 [Candidatus Kuenenbacteria bacterium RIFCSPLOWO2_02_FULL_42_16]OGG91626.1 MAG: hypothetical protein A3H03_02955 [Candidatus Kuenenbacteria bacterium RIFCSPLOWO2_12_FULL_42_13]OGG98646.1 MAG: hypothetical protein A3E04_01330 [Candidatus K
MNIEKIILTEITNKKSLRVADIVKITGFSRAYINRFFKKLAEEGKIILIGKASKSSYIKATKESIRRKKNNILEIKMTLMNQNLSEDLILEQIKRESGIFLDIPNNISKIVDYAFTEMLNNAIEHSQSNNIEILIERDEDKIRFDVIDKGIGIFKNIIQKRKLKNNLEAIQELTKGKQTTAPKLHSGEGIFFTSKLGDTLIIQSSNNKLLYNNIVEDVFVYNIKKVIGTRVTFIVSLNSRKKIDSIFREYSSNLYDFTKTEVNVKLYKMAAEYISRSQAKRLTSGLEKFKKIVLDFDKVETVGQGFADEVFRVWQNKYPTIKIEIKNANKNIDFMIARVKGNR